MISSSLRDLKLQVESALLSLDSSELAEPTHLEQEVVTRLRSYCFVEGGKLRRPIHEGSSISYALVSNSFDYLVL